MGIPAVIFSVFSTIVGEFTLLRRLSDPDFGMDNKPAINTKAIRNSPIA
jgi:hypothetical protein